MLIAIWCLEYPTQALRNLHPKVSWPVCINAHMTDCPQLPCLLHVFTASFLHIGRCASGFGPSLFSVNLAQVHLVLTGAMVIGLTLDK